MYLITLILLKIFHARSDQPRGLRVDRQFSSRLKRPGRCIQDAPSSNAEVENGLELYSGLPPVIAYACLELTFTVALLASLLLVYFTQPQYIYFTHLQVRLFHRCTVTHACVLSRLNASL